MKKKEECHRTGICEGRKKSGGKVTKEGFRERREGARRSAKRQDGRQR